jgi:cytidine deaminase
VWPEINTRTHDRQDSTAKSNRATSDRKISTVEGGEALQWPPLVFNEIALGMQTTKVSVAMRERLLSSARRVMKNAYAPYSHFRVGAAVLTSKGKVFVGCNVENSSYGMTNCAERTAIFSAVAKIGPELEIRAVAVAAVDENDCEVPCTPCGACRQVIYEFGPRAIIFYQGEKGPKQSLITDLLPEGFRLK